MRKAVVLLSGGLDSTTALYWAISKGYECYCLIFDYGQKHEKEIKYAKKIAVLNGCQFKVANFDLPWGGSSLISKDESIPVHELSDIGKDKVPSTYVPARNIIFLSFAASWAEVLGAESVVLGANCLDFSGYPDCRPDFLRSFRRMTGFGTRSGSNGRKMEISAPLLRKNKAQIIRSGMKLGVPYEKTWSCYNGRKKPCGRCDSCKLRAKGFKEAGVKDPLLR